MAFTYKAKNQDGKIVTGTIDKDSRPEAMEFLQNQRMTPISLEQTKQAVAINIPFLDNLLHRIKLKDIIMFTRNLAGMVKAGVAISRALEVLARQTKNPNFKKILQEILEDIKAGGAFSDALSKHPKVFSKLYVSMMEAGEESGQLVESLKDTETSLVKNYTLRRRVKSAMMYPSVIIGVIILIAILMFIYVVPTLTKIFTDLGTELPWSTQLIINLSDFLRENTLTFFGVLIAVVVGIIFALRQPKVSRGAQWLVLRFPAVKTIIKQMNAARTARTLSSLLSSGVALVRGIEITQNVIQNVWYFEALEKTKAAVLRGEPMSGTIKEASPTLFPPMLGELMEVGEETGDLAQMLRDVAEFYEQEVDDKTKNLSTIIEPVLMVFIGGGVGFFAVSMLQPMYSIMDSF